MLFSFFGVSLFAIPFLFSHSTIDPVLTPRFLIWAILLLVMTVVVTIPKVRLVINLNFNIAYRIVYPAFVFYLIIGATSLSQATNISEGIFELLKTFLSLTFLFLATLILRSNRKGIPILIKFITISALAFSVIGICQYYQLAFNSIPGNSFVYGTMANRNLYSSALFLTFPFILFGVLRFFGIWRILSTLSMILVLHNIIIAETRAVWVAMAVATVSLGLLTVVLRKRRIFTGPSLLKQNRLGQVTIILFMVVIISTSISKYYYPNYSPVARIASLANLENESSRERITLWSKSVQMIRDNPVLGVGLGNWKIALPHYGTSGMRSESGIVHFQRPHNDYLWVLCESGILGLICYSSIFVIIIGYIFKIIIQSSSSEDKLFSIIMLFGIVGYMTISFFSFPKERISHLILLMLTMASIVSIYDKTFHIQKSLKHASILKLTIPSLILLSLSVFVGYTRLSGEIHTKRALAARVSSNWEDVIDEIDMAESWFSNMDPMSTPLVWYRGVANFSLNKVDEASKDFQCAYEIHPFHIHVLNNLATSYELLGDHNSAIEHYSKALEISPKFEDSLINLGAVYYNIGRYEEALETLMRCNPDSKNEKLSLYLQEVRNKLKHTDPL